MPHRNLTLLALLVGASVPGFGGDRAVSTKPVGTMIGTGPVWLDGSPASEFSAPPGAALFGGDVIQTGKVVLADTAQNLLNNPMMREAYLGEL